MEGSAISFAPSLQNQPARSTQKSKILCLGKTQQSTGITRHGGWNFLDISCMLLKRFWGCQVEELHRKWVKAKKSCNYQRHPASHFWIESGARQSKRFAAVVHHKNAWWWLQACIESRIMSLHGFTLYTLSAIIACLAKCCTCSFCCVNGDRNTRKTKRSVLISNASMLTQSPFA